MSATATSMRVGVVSPCPSNGRGIDRNAGPTGESGTSAGDSRKSVYLFAFLGTFRETLVYWCAMKLASVILDIPTQALDAPYIYAVPEEGLFAAACEGAGDSDDGPVGRDFAISVGCAVLVPFGHRRAVGFVVSIGECGQPGGPQWPQGIDAGKLKAIERAVSQPYFDEEGAACAQWLSERYIAPLSACVRLFTPPGGVPRMVHGRDGRWRLEQPAVGQVDDRWVVAGPAFSEFTPRANAVKQVAVMEALRGGQLRVSELAAQLGSVSSTLKALEAKGAVVIEHRRRMRGFSEDAARIAQRAVSGAAGDTAGEEAVGFGEAAGGGVVEGGAAGFATVCEGHAGRLCADDADLAAGNESAAHVPSRKPQLTPGQAQALDAISSACDAADGHVVLVDGVTGSGKTEVYLQAIERVLAQGRTACVLVPEIWIAFAEASGIPELKSTTRDEPDYDKLMKFRLDVLRRHGMGLPQIQEVIADIQPVPGAKEFLDDLRAQTQVIIISDTFEQFAQPIMEKLGWPTIFCNTLEVADDGTITGYRMRCDQTKLTTVRALHSCGFETIASGDSYNDLGMIKASKAGFLFRSTVTIKAEHPEIPAYETFEDLSRAIRAAL